MIPTFVVAVISSDAERLNVRISGELDLAATDELARALSGATAKTVVADLSGLTFLDGAGLRALIAAKRKIEGSGGRLEVQGATGRVRWVFSLTDTEFLLAGAA